MTIIQKSEAEMEKEVWRVGINFVKGFCSPFSSLDFKGIEKKLLLAGKKHNLDIKVRTDEEELSPGKMKRVIVELRKKSSFLAGFLAGFYCENCNRYYVGIPPRFEIGERKENKGLVGGHDYISYYCPICNEKIGTRIFCLT